MAPEDLLGANFLGKGPINAKQKMLVALATVYRSQFRTLGWLLKYYACIKPVAL